jgi:hypothetical protein
VQAGKNQLSDILSIIYQLIRTLPKTGVIVGMGNELHINEKTGDYKAAGLTKMRIIFHKFYSLTHQDDNGLSTGS